MPNQMLKLGREKKGVLHDGSYKIFSNGWWHLSVCSQSQENLNPSPG